MPHATCQCEVCIRVVSVREYDSGPLGLGLPARGVRRRRGVRAVPRRVVPLSHAGARPPVTNRARAAQVPLRKCRLQPVSSRTSSNQLCLSNFPGPLRAGARFDC
eukprot:3735463-Prymnesium_polylepis.1